MQEAQDLRYFVSDQQRFNVRAAVILTHAGQVLVTPTTTPAGAPAVLVPGGAVKFGETGEAAALRELQEELGLFLPALNFTGIIEAFFTRDPIDYQQLLLVYQAPVDAATAQRLARLDATAHDLPAGTTFTWQPEAQVAATILPAALGQCLRPGVFHHLIDRRG